MQQEKQRFQYLWNAFNNNTATEAETRELLSLLNQEEETAIDAFMEEAAQPYLSQSATPALPTWQAIEQRLLQKEAAKAKSITKKRWLWRSAAAAAVAATVITLLTITPRTVTLAADNADRYITLSDGSIVILQKGSALRFSKKFGQSQRSVQLTGQAYFDVARNAGKPFIVQTSKVNTTVLGTTFSVTALPNSGQVSINVTSGKVKVERGQQLLQVLAASQGLEASIEGNQFTTYQTTEEKATSWLNAELSFNNLTWQQIANRLSSRFGVTIQFAANAIATLTVSTTLSGNATLSQMLDILCAATGTTYHINDQQVVISKK